MPDLTGNLSVDDLHDRASVPVWHWVCGRRLQQMTVGHARLIDAMGLWKPTTPDDLLLCAFVCSRTYRTALRQFDSTTLRWRIRWMRWMQGARWDWRKSLVGWFRFVRYHREEPYAVARPLDPTRPVISQPINSPWLAHLRAFLCAEGGYSPESFDDQLLGQVVLDYYAILESKDRIVLANLTRTAMAKRLEEAKNAKHRT